CLILCVCWFSDRRLAADVRPEQRRRWTMHPRIRLTLITPPQGLGCREYILERRGRYVLGRSRDCDIMLPAEGVSRHHCRLALDPPTLRVRDLGSRNGTYLNGESIGKRSCPEPLAGEDKGAY